MKNYGQVIHRTWDNSYVINNGTYHVPNEADYASLWQEVHEYALTHPDMVAEEAPYVPSLDEVKVAKITSLKAQRDVLEVEDITVDGNTFDYDEKARERINNAIIALQASGTSILWTLADNNSVLVTAQDLIAVVSAVAVRSNALHIAYRDAKAKVNAAMTAEEVKVVELEV